ncbi:50S ribosomal protein L29 [Limisalsivibrio acetivorans]|uniref:50S ribosomal protein L29 n=1 Tax=Limisalsivibrio acetivorans TaxID=1304888 RepID=UPI0003B4585B|nr:50S ribosomal protein L29 [Limisalsivibrio acetivorans]
MKTSEFIEMSTDELIAKQNELREDLFRARFKLATGDLEDTSVLKKMRKDIARIKTLLHQRETEKAEN